jgi:hypothetical protein
MTYSQADAAKPGNDPAAMPDPAESLRLLKAFMTIANPKTRETAIDFVESLANSQKRDAG